MVTPLLLLRAQNGDKGLLRHGHTADHLHPLLARLLLFQKFPLSGDVTSVALRRDVFAERIDCPARDDSSANGSLDRDLELLPRDRFFEPLAGVHGVLPRLGAVDKLRQGI